MPDPTLPYEGVLDPPTSGAADEAAPPGITDYPVLATDAKAANEGKGALSATVDALTKRDARTDIIREMAVESPNLSDRSNEAVRDIQRHLDSTSWLKKVTAVAPWFVDVATKVRDPRMRFPLSLLMPEAAPSKATRKIMPGAADSVDIIVSERVKGIVTEMLMRRDLTAEEQNYWKNMASLMDIPH